MSMIPLAVPDLSGNERKYLNRCIDTTFVSSVGEYVTELERRCAEICGAAYGVATSAGTTGLHIALLACGVKPGELVILPSFTFIATANAAAHCGALPWLMDIERDSWTMDPEKLRFELSRQTERRNGATIHKPTGRRVAALLPVYTLGNLADMSALREIAGEYGIPLLADAACAIGATRAGRPFGGFADVSVLSFNGNKTVTAGGGGMVLGDDRALMEKIRHLTTTARVGTEYDFDTVGYNYRMTNLQAAVGCAQTERVDVLVRRKREIRAFYREALADVGGVSPFPDPEGQESACWFSGLVLERGGLGDVRRICGALRERGIEARTFWKPAHLQKPYLNAPRAEDLRVTEGLWDRMVTLPCSAGITEEELTRVSDALHEIFGKGSGKDESVLM